MLIGSFLNDLSRKRFFDSSESVTVDNSRDDFSFIFFCFSIFSTCVRSVGKVFTTTGLLDDR